MTNNRLAEKVCRFVREQNMLPPHAHLLVGLSGGADSVALLYVMHLLREELAIDRLAAVHIHHGLRGEEADRDEAIAKAHCERCEAVFYSHHADVAAIAEATHSGLEEAGRAVRYRVFRELQESEGFTHVATAHTQNDNTETVLLHLARGTSLAGLRGIPAVRDQIIRPLITCTREEIEAFCTAYGLPYAVDSTNADESFARNRVRNCIVPHLYILNPRVHEAVYRLGEMAAEDEEYWQSATEEAIEEAAYADGVYRTAVLSTLPRALQRRVIRRIVSRCDGECEEHHVRRIASLLETGGAVLVGGGVAVTVKQGYLTVGTSADAADECELKAGETYRFGNTVYRAEVWDRNTFENYRKVHKILLQYTCDYDKIKGTAYVRTRREGDACSPYLRGGRRSLKKWFNSEKIPEAMRADVPVVADADGVALVVGMGCDTRTAIDENTQRILIFYIIEEGKTYA